MSPPFPCEAAKHAGAQFFDEAIALANRTPCDPKTLTRAARGGFVASIIGRELGLA